MSDCKMCKAPVPAGARICQECGTIQSIWPIRYLGASIPLIAATLSVLFLLGDRIYDLMVPPRAHLFVEAPAVRYGLDEIRIVVANLGDVVLLVPPVIDCTTHGDVEVLNAVFGSFAYYGDTFDENEQPIGDGVKFGEFFARSNTTTPAIVDGAATLIFTLSDQSWVPKPQAGHDFLAECTLQFADAQGELEPHHMSVAFRTLDEGVITYVLDGIGGLDPDSPPSGLLFGAQRSLAKTAN